MIKRPYRIAAMGLGISISIGGAAAIIGGGGPAAPTITSITPSHASQVNSTSVTLVTTGLVSGATATCGGVNASLVFGSSTSATATCPVHAAGASSFVITNPDAQTASTAYTFDAWIPTDSSNLKEWLRADVGFTPSQWSDQSGLGNHFTQATTARQPASVANVVGSLPGIQFTGANTNFMTGGAWSTYVTSSTATMLAVVEPITIQDSGQGISYNNTGWLADDSGYSTAANDNTGPKAVAGLFSTIDNIVKVNLVGLSVPYLHTQRHSGGSLFLSVNSGSESTVTAANMGATSSVAHLGRGLNAHYFNGYIFEVLIYSVNLDTQRAGDLALAKNYLKTRWGTP